MSANYLIPLHFSCIPLGVPWQSVGIRAAVAEQQGLGQNADTATQERFYRAEVFMRVHSELQRQLHGYRLTTAEILYHLPDHPGLLQSYVWQDLDMAPRFPVLHKFLHFWSHEIEGKLHSVRVAAVQLIGPGEWRHTEHLTYLH
jgi:uncharacterized protein Usg